MRRIFASVSEEDFYACLAKCKAVGLSLGECLAKLVHEYVEEE
jgi:hypothetical protein